jgi:hypothetical protein
VKKLMLAAIAIGALLVPGPAAHAHDDEDFAGPGCTPSTVNDTTPGGQLGGQNQWNGQVSTLVIPTEAGVPSGAEVQVDCELLINGNTQGVVLSASGTGIAAAAGPLSYTAEATDVITICTIVIIIHNHPPDGTHSHVIIRCRDLTTTQIVPQPLIDAINLVLDFIADNTIIVDQTVCPIIANQGIPGVVHFDSGGDMYVLNELFLDCYPYQT